MTLTLCYPELKKCPYVRNSETQSPNTGSLFQVLAGIQLLPVLLASPRVNSKVSAMPELPVN